MDYNSLVPADAERTTVCPFNKSHVVLNFRFANHLVKCRKNYDGSEMETCPYNVSHIVPKPEFYFHKKTCTDRILVLSQMLKEQNQPNKTRRVWRDWDDDEEADEKKHSSEPAVKKRLSESETVKNGNESPIASTSTAIFRGDAGVNIKMTASESSIESPPKKPPTVDPSESEDEKSVSDCETVKMEDTDYDENQDIAPESPKNSQCEGPGVLELCGLLNSSAAAKNESNSKFENRRRDPCNQHQGTTMRIEESFKENPINREIIRENRESLERDPGIVGYECSGADPEREIPVEPMYQHHDYSPMRFYLPAFDGQEIKRELLADDEYESNQNFKSRPGIVDPNSESTNLNLQVSANEPTSSEPRLPNIKHEVVSDDEDGVSANVPDQVPEVPSVKKELNEMDNERSKNQTKFAENGQDIGNHRSHPRDWNNDCPFEINERAHEVPRVPAHHAKTSNFRRQSDKNNNKQKKNGGQLFEIEEYEATSPIGREQIEDCEVSDAEEEVLDSNNHEDEQNDQNGPNLKVGAYSYTRNIHNDPKSKDGADNYPRNIHNDPNANNGALSPKYMTSNPISPKTNQNPIPSTSSRDPRIKSSPIIQQKPQKLDDDWSDDDPDLDNGRSSVTYTLNQVKTYSSAGQFHERRHETYSMDQSQSSSPRARPCSQRSRSYRSVTPKSSESSSTCQKSYEYGYNKRWSGHSYPKDRRPTQSDRESGYSEEADLSRPATSYSRNSPDSVKSEQITKMAIDDDWSDDEPIFTKRVKPDSSDNRISVNIDAGRLDNVSISLNISMNPRRKQSEDDWSDDDNFSSPATTSRPSTSQQAEIGRFSDYLRVSNAPAMRTKSGAERGARKSNPMRAVAAVNKKPAMTKKKVNQRSSDEDILARFARISQKDAQEGRDTWHDRMYRDMVEKK